jgi:hypothetical protein
MFQIWSFPRCSINETPSLLNKVAKLAPGIPVRLLQVPSERRVIRTPNDRHSKRAIKPRVCPTRRRTSSTVLQPANEPIPTLQGANAQSRLLISDVCAGGEMWCQGTATMLVRSKSAGKTIVVGGNFLGFWRVNRPLQYLPVRCSDTLAGGQ